MIEACLEAYRITQVNDCFESFLGGNDMQTLVYDYKSGGCCDGLTANGVNRNQGAESTLAWLLSLLHVYTAGSTIFKGVREKQYSCSQ